MAKKAVKKATPAPAAPVVPADVCMMSMFRDDEQRGLVERIQHLLDKQGVDRWVWIVGNSSDQTETILRAVAAERSDVTVLRYDSDVLGDDPDSRLTRLSQTANAGLADVRDTDAYYIIHESDLRSPADIVPQLMTVASEGNRAVAGMVWLGEDERVFYDSWGFTAADGGNFTNQPPHHPTINRERPFEVRTAGSILLFPAQHLRDGLRLTWGGMRELCLNLKARGVSIWVHPHVNIVQPVALWTSMSHATWRD